MERENRTLLVTPVQIWLISCLLLFMVVHKSAAQSLTWEEFVERMTTEEEREQTSWQHLYEELAERHAHPFNLNELTREQLETLPFLTSEQIEELLAYVYVHKPVLTLSELQLVEGLDYDTRAMLSLFVYAGEVGKQTAPLRWKNLGKYGENEFIARVDIPFYYRKGYYRYPLMCWNSIPIAVIWGHVSITPSATSMITGHGFQPALWSRTTQENLSLGAAIRAMISIPTISFCMMWVGCVRWHWAITG